MQALYKPQSKIKEQLTLYQICNYLEPFNFKIPNLEWKWSISKYVVLKSNATSKLVSKPCGFDLIVLIVINNATKGDFFAAMQDKNF